MLAVPTDSAPSSNMAAVQQRTQRAFYQRDALELINFDFEEAGFGGLPEETKNEIVSLFLRMVLPEEVCQGTGIEQPLGVILVGPPGTGKTMFARLCADVLSPNPPVFVASPEILNEMVGGSVEKLKKIFEPSLEDARINGENASLTVFVFDEFDAIGAQRGSRDKTGAGGMVNDQIVTEFLNVMGGLAGNKNILVFALTNDASNLDEALLRSGRFGTKIHFGLPGERARASILDIHTKTLRENSYMSISQREIDDIATDMQNYTGADIKQVVQIATSDAVMRKIPEIEEMRKRFPSKAEIARKKEAETLNAISKNSGEIVKDLFRKASTSGVKIGLEADGTNNIAAQLIAADMQDRIQRKVAEGATPLPILYASGDDRNPQRVGIPYVPCISTLSGSASRDVQRQRLENVKRLIELTTLGRAGISPSITIALEAFERDPASFVGVRKVREEILKSARRMQEEGRDFSRVVQVTAQDLRMAMRKVHPQSGSSRALIMPFRDMTPLCQRHGVLFDKITSTLERFSNSTMRNFFSVEIRGPLQSGRTTMVRRMLTRLQPHYPFINIIDVGFHLSHSPDTAMSLLERHFLRAITEAEHATSNALIVLDGIERIPRNHPLMSQVREIALGTRYFGKHVARDAFQMVVVVIGEGNEWECVCGSSPAHLTFDADMCLRTKEEKDSAVDILFPGISAASRLKDLPMDSFPPNLTAARLWSSFWN